MLISGLLFLIAIYFIWYSFDLDMGTLRRPGPGAAPLVCALLLGSISAFMFLSFAKAPPAEDDINYRSIILCIVGIFIWAIIARPTGLLPSTLACTLIVSFAEKPWKPVRTLITFSIILIVTYLLFIQLLSAPIALIGEY